MERWRSEGRTAEQLGAPGLEWDRFARRSRLDDTARRCFDDLDADTRRWCGGLCRRREPRARRRPARTPPSSRHTGTSPAPWQPWTPSGCFPGPPHPVRQLSPTSSGAPTSPPRSAPDAVDLFSIEAPGLVRQQRLGGPRQPDRTPVPRSWPGTRTGSWSCPGVYQQVRLACPEFDVVGLAFPGVPGIPHFGHAGTVAWAITNAMADYQDLYAEELRRSAVRRRSPWSCAAGSRRRRPSETLAVRGAAPVTVEIIETDRGPVISGGPDGAALSLRTPARVEWSLGFEALLPAPAEPLLRRRGGSAGSLGGTRQLRAGGRHLRRRAPVRGRAVCRAGTGTTAAGPSRHGPAGISGPAARRSCRRSDPCPVSPSAPTTGMPAAGSS